MKTSTLDTLKNFRQTLHQHPELSNQEKQTAEQLVRWLQDFSPSEIITDIGGNGLIALWEGPQEGPTICLRAELDALPIEEENTFSYRSQVPNVSHKCGHDGHMTILLGVAQALHQNPPERGKVLLLFQTAEETGEGAQRMLLDDVFKKLPIDQVFALHNLPGYAKHTIVCRADTFAAASIGMTTTFEGATAHAGEPENGRSPALALAESITLLQTLPQQLITESFALVTVVQALLGEVSFGVAPGYAEVRATLRSYLDEDLDLLLQTAKEQIQAIADRYQLACKITYTEHFTSTNNHVDSVRLIKQIAKLNGLAYEEKATPFRWSEDFGQFTQRYQGAMFGLGAGIGTPQLHNADYDFPDDLLASGVAMFDGLIRHLLDKDFT
ncbi:MAG: amidohydrolase [Thermonemataceae bacterium]